MNKFEISRKSFKKLPNFAKWYLGTDENFYLGQGVLTVFIRDAFFFSGPFYL